MLVAAWASLAGVGAGFENEGAARPAVLYWCVCCHVTSYPAPALSLLKTTSGVYMGLQSLGRGACRGPSHKVAI